LWRIAIRRELTGGLSLPPAADAELSPTGRRRRLARFLDHYDRVQDQEANLRQAREWARAGSRADRLEGYLVTPGSRCAFMSSGAGRPWYVSPTRHRSSCDDS
jgi:hypothetical protein